VSGVQSEVKELVRRGYDQVARSYLAARPRQGDDVALLGDLLALVAPGGRVLDAGCGAGQPVSAALMNGGLSVIGLDISARQLQMGRSEAGLSGPVQGDLAGLPFADASFDGVVSYYAIFHLPRAEHPTVFAELRRVLRPGGHALLCLGARDVPEDRDDDSWLGGPMYWSQFDGPTNVDLLVAAGFHVRWCRPVVDPMGHGSHLFVLAETPRQA
jgi:SAM-dependent methyltransferase